MKINLEKELIRQNAKIATPEELLLIKEFEKVGDLKTSFDVLGFTHLDHGEFIKKKTKHLSDQTQKFNKSRVFHVSQIKSIAEKYYLRFLPSDRYMGSVDKELPLKIGNFEASYDIQLKKGDCFILAPKESFMLEEKPKDPLLFYRINSEYYYLIHKWGNDLNITRRIKAIYSNNVVSFLTTYFAFVAIIGIIGLPSHIVFFIVASLTTAPIFTGLTHLIIDGFNNSLSYVKPNDWNSDYM